MTTSDVPPLSYEERTEHILDAAARLLLRYGYKRVTINDIATEADVGTGTIYLHWKTKTTLFESVLLRELLSLWGALRQHMAEEPETALLHRFLGTMLRLIKERPLARALFTQDVALLGKLTRSTVVTQSQQMTNASQLIEMLRQLGLMRTDESVETQAYAFSAIWTGFVFVDQFLTDADRAPIATQVDALAQTIERTLGPPQPPTEANVREQIAPAICAFLQETETYFSQQLDRRLVDRT